MLAQEIKKKMIQNSISLEMHGLNDLAWNKEDAKKLINEIMKDSVGILGGDVYRLTSIDIEALSENWFCEPAEKESEEEYYLRSKLESLDYIENYSAQFDEKIIFSITFTETII